MLMLNWTELVVRFRQRLEGTHLPFRWSVLRPLLLCIFSDVIPDVFRPFTDHVLEELSKFEKLSVLWIAQPSEYFNTVLFLALEVIFDVVDDDCLLEISVQQSKVLDVNAIIV